MTRKLLALVPSTLPSSANLGRFHPDATDTPLLSVVHWTSRSSSSATRTRQLALDKDQHNLLELQRFKPVDGARSWFVGNAVLQDGGVLVLSPVDALFVLLDAAWPQRARFSSVYDLLATAGNTWLLQLSTLRRVIVCICDVQDIEEGDDAGVENLYVKVDENKVVLWLRTKVERVAKVLLKQEQDAAMRAATTAAFSEQVNVVDHSGLETKLPEEEIQDEGGALARHYRHAIDVVGNYLADEWIAVLCSEFGVEKEEKVKSVAKAAAGPIDSFQRFDRRLVPENRLKRPTSVSAVSVKKKSKLDNVDRSGMKSLTSFFGKK